MRVEWEWLCLCVMNLCDVDYKCVFFEGGASEQGPSVAVVKGGGSESDEEYVEESGGSDQEGYSSVEEGELHSFTMYKLYTCTMFSLSAV